MPSARRRVAIAGPAPLRKVASVSSVSGGRGPPRVGSAGTKLFGDDDRVGFHTRTLGELRHTDRGTRRNRRLEVLRHDFVDARAMGGKSDARRIGTEWFGTCITRWSPDHKKKK